ncbi:hypothetical protein [Clostridium sp.]|uniref:hypothetical protein n=1 Tax=Clostridium sp. TaxID=1506 RepID=UPI0034647C09
MSNCNKGLIDVLNTMNEYINYGEESLKNSILNEEFEDGMNAFIEAFIMIEKVIETHSDKLKEITEKEKSKLALGLELSVEKINKEQDYNLEDYFKNVVEPFVNWKNRIINNIELAN